MKMSVMIRSAGRSRCARSPASPLPTSSTVWRARSKMRRTAPLTCASSSITRIRAIGLGAPGSDHARRALGGEAEQRADGERNARANRLVNGVHVETECDARTCERAGGERENRHARLNSSHQIISYAVFCLKKKKKQ